MISTRHYNPAHYRFQREQSRSTASWDHSPAVSSYGMEIARLVGIGACVALLTGLAWVISEIFS